MMAAFNNVDLPFTLLFWGQIHISIGLASILNATSRCSASWWRMS